jgi:hypothetical protein
MEKYKNTVEQLKKSNYELNLLQKKLGKKKIVRTSEPKKTVSMRKHSH